jgi:hypothetical protein
MLGEEAEINVFSDMNAVWTEPGQEWVQRVFEISGRHLGARPAAKTATYNTDAGNLLSVYKGAPAVVLGPGEAAQAHQTDEYCSMERIRQSVAIYEDLIRDWCGVWRAAVFPDRVARERAAPKQPGLFCLSINPPLLAGSLRTDLRGASPSSSTGSRSSTAQTCVEISVPPRAARPVFRARRRGGRSSGLTV